MIQIGEASIVKGILRLSGWLLIVEIITTNVHAKEYVTVLWSWLLHLLLLLLLRVHLVIHAL
jgi:hypothetical protein